MLHIASEIENVQSSVEYRLSVLETEDAADIADEAETVEQGEEVHELCILWIVDPTLDHEAVVLVMNVRYWGVVDDDDFGVIEWSRIDIGGDTRCSRPRSRS